MPGRPRINAGMLLALLGLALALALVPTRAASAAENKSDLQCDTSQPDDHSGTSSQTPPDAIGENIQQYQIDVEVHDDGSATFTETITYDFAHHARHGIYRDVIIRQPCNGDYVRSYPFTLLSVASPSGAPADVSLENTVPEGSDPLELIGYWRSGVPIRRIRIGDPNRTITGTATYEIVYELEGVANRSGDSDQFYWNVIGNGWRIPIRDVTVSVQTPTGATGAQCFAGATGVRTSCTSGEVVEGQARFTQDQLGPGENLTVLVSYPPGDVAPVALVDDRWSLAAAFAPTPMTVGSAGLLLVLAVAGFVVLLWRVGRDEQLAGSPVDIAFAPVDAQGGRKPLFDDDHSPVEFVPPDDIRPGQAGLLVDEVVHPVDVTASIVDLAVRGYLRIDEIEKKFRRDDYEITRSDKDTEGLLQYEGLLLKKLVATPGSSIKLSELRYKFADDFEKVVRAMYNDGVQRRWFNGRPDKVRAKWKRIAWLVIVLSVLLLVGGVLFTKLALVALPLLLAGILLRIGARFMPRRTAKGSGLLRRVRGFEEFIRDSEAPRAQWAENRNIFSEYLPYAIVFRCADKWAKTFEDLGVEQDLTWYHGNDFRPIYVSSAMSSFASSAGTSLSASAPSSGGSGGGGGFSGGGGGGGGGGSW